MQFLMLIMALSSTGEGVVLSAQDLGTLPGELRPYIRYMLLPEEEDAPKILNGHCNQLSRNPEIIQTAVIGGKVLRINLKDYSWGIPLWETLANVDPYFHVDVLVGGKKVRAVSPILAEGVVEQTIKGEKFHHSVKANLEFLVSNTQSKVPLVRGDWFVNQTAIQAGRNPGYFDFLGIKDQNDVFKLTGFDPKTAKDIGKILRESVSISGVTQQPRAYRIDRTQTGNLLRSFDFIKGTDKKNPLRILGEDIEGEADAEEWFFSLPNGLWGTFLQNGQKKRQDSAPDTIATNRLSKSNDHRIHINVTCIACHTNGGIQPLEGFVRQLAHPPPNAVGSPDYDKFILLRREYLRSMEGEFARARLQYEQYIEEATRSTTVVDGKPVIVPGWDSKTYAAKYYAFWQHYEEAKVDLAWAAKDLGVKAETFKAIIEKRIAQGYVDPNYGGVDLVLAGIVRGSSVGIRQWEEVYTLAQTILRGERP